MKDYNIGDEFHLGRTKIRVENSDEDNCVGCIFQKMSWVTCDLLEDFIGYCGSNTRKDKKSIIFVKVEENEK